MKISRLVYANIDLLYDIFKNIVSDQEFNTVHGIPKAYGDITVTFFVEDASLFEAFIISRISDGYITKVTVENSFDSEKYAELHENVDKIMQATITIDNDDDIKYSPSEALLPIGCHRRDLTVSFTGENLIKLIGSNVVELMQALFADEKTEKIKGGDGEIQFPEEFPLNDEKFINKLVNVLIMRFRKQFYELYNTIVIRKEDGYESYLHEQYFKYLSKKSFDIAPAFYTSHCGILNFMGNKHDNQKQIANLKKTIQECNYNIMNGTLTVAVRSSLLTFLELITIAGDIKFQNENFNTCLENPAISVPSYMQRYQTRVMKRVGDINTIKLNTHSEHSNPYYVYEMIIGIDKLNYTLTIPFMHSFKALIESISGQEKISYTDKELLDIFTGIENFKSSISDLLTNG